ncbi:MAG: YddF family protein [Firmicutes bacterium]|nr:YddF family protein [Bacillota bacterium]
MEAREFYDQEDYTSDLEDLRRLEGCSLPVVIFNGPVCTNNGLYRLSDLGLAEARKLLAEKEFISAVGHQASAEVLSALLGVEIPLNRIEYYQLAGQDAIALNLNQRPPEGQILDAEEMLAVGFTLKLLERLQ